MNYIFICGDRLASMDVFNEYCDTYEFIFTIQNRLKLSLELVCGTVFKVMDVTKMHAVSLYEFRKITYFLFHHFQRITESHLTELLSVSSYDVGEQGPRCFVKWPVAFSVPTCNYHYYQLDAKKQRYVKVDSRYSNFHARKRIWKCPLHSTSLLQHYNVIMGAMVSQITGVSFICSAVCLDEIKHQSSASLAFVRGIHRWPLDSHHKGPVRWTTFPFDDVIMTIDWLFLPLLESMLSHYHYCQCHSLYIHYSCLLCYVTE